MPQLIVGLGAPVEVAAGTGGALIANAGPATVSYADSPDVQFAAEGTIAPAASETLYGSVWLYAASRADLNVTLLPPSVGTSSAPVIVPGGDLGAAFTFDLEGALNVWLVGTLTDDCTITLDGLAEGASAKLLLVQDGTGSHTLVLSDGVDGVSVPVDLTPDAPSHIEVAWDGSDLFVIPGGTESSVIGSGIWSPMDQGLLGWSFAPTDIDTTGEVMSNGGLHFMRVPVPESGLIGAVGWQVVASPTTTTASRLAVYRKDGTLLGLTADVAAAWAATGIKDSPFIAEIGQSLVAGGPEDDWCVVGLTWAGTGTARAARARQGPNSDAAASYRASTKLDQRATTITTGGAPPTGGATSATFPATLDMDLVGRTFGGRLWVALRS